MKPSYFLSCDWGTTHFRLRLVDNCTGVVVDEIKTADGVAGMAGTGEGGECRESRYASYLGSQAEVLIAKHSVEVGGCVVSGMASSRLGWRELPYAELPQPLDGARLISHTMQVPLKGAPALAVLLVSGIRSDENVMRGEEIELVGLAQRIPALVQAASALLIMPGTHSKHVRLSQGVIVGFDTFMTGELFAHLSSVPTLSSSLLSTASFDEADPWFIRGLHEAASAGFFKSIFKIRSRNLLQGAQPAEGAAYLSGLLIGTEMLQIPAIPGQRIFLAASGKLGALYSKAVLELAIPGVETIKGEVMERAAIDGQLHMLHSALDSAS